MVLWKAKLYWNSNFKDFSWLSHDKFVSVNNVLKEYNEMKEGLENSAEYI